MLRHFIVTEPIFFFCACRHHLLLLLLLDFIVVSDWLLHTKREREKKKKPDRLWDCDKGGCPGGFPSSSKLAAHFFFLVRGRVFDFAESLARSESGTFLAGTTRDARRSLDSFFIFSCLTFLPMQNMECHSRLRRPILRFSVFTFRLCWQVVFTSFVMMVIFMTPFIFSSATFCQSIVESMGGHSTEEGGACPLFFSARVSSIKCGPTPHNDYPPQELHSLRPISAIGRSARSG